MDSTEQQRICIVLGCDSLAGKFGPTCDSCYGKSIIWCEACNGWVEYKTLGRAVDDYRRIKCLRCGQESIKTIWVSVGDFGRD